MIINNVAIPDPDVGDFEFATKFEKQCEIILKKTASINKNIKLSEGIKTQCTMIFEFFDAVFGEGTAKKIFGDKVNLKTCIDAYEEAINGVKALENNLAEYIKNKGKNRQQRRSAQK